MHIADKYILFEHFISNTQLHIVWTLLSIRIHNFNTTHVFGTYYPQFDGMSIIYGHFHVVCTRGMHKPVSIMETFMLCSDGSAPNSQC